VWVKKAEGGSKTGAKVALANEGPFEVLEVLGVHTYSVRRIGEAVSIRKKIHAENMGPYSDIKEVEAKVSRLRGPYKKKKKQQPKAKAAKNKVWEVSEVVGSRGSLADKNKEYQVRWAGFEKKDDSWLPEAELFHCSRLAQEFNLRQVGINHISEEREDGEALDSMYLEVDLLELAGMKGAMALEELCRRAGIDIAYRVFAWASPPCETMSYLVANWSNWTSIFQYSSITERRRRDIHHARMPQSVH
jgi:hypothetical protein